MTVKEQLDEKSYAGCYVQTDDEVYEVGSVPDHVLEKDIDEVRVIERELLFDDHHGVYIPQLFGRYIIREGWNIEEEKWDKLAGSDPYDEDYWEVWDEVLMNASHKDGWYLYQDGALFAERDVT